MSTLYLTPLPPIWNPNLLKSLKTLGEPFPHRKLNRNLEGFVNN